ncbi:nucleoside triphosphate pyrophosphohydrolase ham1, partial [Chytridiales sp. JEL 0842]
MNLIEPETKRPKTESEPHTITFVTGNANKLKEVEAILATASHIKLVNQKIDLPELQAATAVEVAIDKCKRA